MSGAEPWHGWNSAVRVADVARRRHAHAADQRGGLVGQDVAEHVLGHDDVEVPRLAHEVERRRVDVVMVGARRPGKRAARSSKILRKNAIERNTFALSTQVTRPGRPRALRRRGEAEREVVDALASRGA